VSDKPLTMYQRALIALGEKPDAPIIGGKAEDGLTRPLWDNERERLELEELAERLRAESLPPASSDTHWHVAPLRRFAVSYDPERGLATWPIAECLSCGHVKDLAVWREKTDIGICADCLNAARDQRGPCSPERGCKCGEAELRTGTP
jgi:hypothetical protein